MYEAKKTFEQASIGRWMLAIGLQPRAVQRSQLMHHLAIASGPASVWRAYLSWLNVLV